MGGGVGRCLGLGAARLKCLVQVGLWGNKGAWEIFAFAVEVSGFEAAVCGCAVAGLLERQQGLRGREKGTLIVLAACKGED